jgi:cytochrome P450
VVVTEALFATDVIANPFPLLNRLREEDPVHWKADLQTWLVTRQADIIWMLRHPELFYSEIYVRDKGLDLPLAQEERFPSLRLATDSVEYEPVRGVHHLQSLPVVWDCDLETVVVQRRFL